MDPISTTIFAGNAHPALARDIAYHLNLPLGRINVGRFSDGEINVEIMENVRGRDVFIVQPTCPPVNENLMELLDHGRRVPTRVGEPDHGGHPLLRLRPPRPAPSRGARADHGEARREPDRDSPASTACSPSTCTPTRSRASSTFPVDNVYASPVLLGDAWKQKYKDIVVVSPDVGGVERARALAKRLDDAGLAIIDKRRPQPNMAEVMNVIGEVADKTCVLIDDMVDTAGTLCQAAGC